MPKHELKVQILLDVMQLLCKSVTNWSQVWRLTFHSQCHNTHTIKILLKSWTDSVMKT